MMKDLVNIKEKVSPKRLEFLLIDTEAFSMTTEEEGVVSNVTSFDKI
jgi:hypothetical protein